MIDVVIGIIINKKQEICIAKRLFGKHLGGCWEFPGGKVDAGESGFVALQRELREELDIEVESATLWQETTHTYPEWEVSLSFYLVEKFNNEPTGNEGQEVVWVAVSELNKYDFPPANHGVIKQLQLLYATPN